MTDALKAYISSVLTEGRLDRHATQISRLIMRWFKDQVNVHLGENGYECIDKETGEVFECDVGESYMKTFEYDLGGTLLSVVITHIVTNNKNITSSGSSHRPNQNSKWYNSSSLPSISINVGIPLHLHKALSLSTIHENVIDIVKHELEHIFDDALWKEKHRHPFDIPTLSDAEERPRREGDVRDYFLHPSEIQGWVAGIYKRAKFEKKPFIKLAKEQLIKTLPIEERHHFDEILNAWITYAKKRFPKAKL